MSTQDAKQLESDENNVQDWMIGEGAFEETGFVDLEIPPVTQVIGKDAFRDCEKLNSVNIPASVVEIGS